MIEDHRIAFTSPTDKPIVLTARFNATMVRWEATMIVGNFETKEDAIAMCNKLGEFMSWVFNANMQQMKGEEK